MRTEVRFAGIGGQGSVLASTILSEAAGAIGGKEAVQSQFYEAAIRDLEDFLRLRARRLDYEQDEMAPEVFERIEQLRAAGGGQLAR